MARKTDLNALVDARLQALGIVPNGNQINAGTLLFVDFKLRPPTTAVNGAGLVTNGSPIFNLGTGPSGTISNGNSGLTWDANNFAYVFPKSIDHINWGTGFNMTGINSWYLAVYCQPTILNESNDAFFRKGTGTGSPNLQYQISFDSNCQPVAGMGNSTTQPNPNIETVSALNTWVHLAVEWDGPNNLFRYYKNGVSKGTQALTGPLLESGTPFPVYMGRFWQGLGRRTVIESCTLSGKNPATQIALDYANALAA